MSPRPPQSLDLSGNSFSGPLPSVNPASIMEVHLDGNQFTAPNGRLGDGADLYSYASNMLEFILDGNPLGVSTFVNGSVASWIVCRICLMCLGTPSGLTVRGRES